MRSHEQANGKMTKEVVNVNSGGRPAKLTTEVQERILGAIRTHQRVEVAAGLAGVGRSTLYGWLSVGAKAKERIGKGTKRAELTAHESQCSDFFEAVWEATAIAEAHAVHTIRVAGTRPSVETKTTRRCVGIEDGEPVFAVETTTTERPPDARARAVVAGAPGTGLPERDAIGGLGD